jgi:alpha-galactosidase
MTEAPTNEVVHLRRGGTSVVLRVGSGVLPCVWHWGVDLGEVPVGVLGGLVAGLGMPFVDSVMASQEAVAVLPQHSSGWSGRPGLLGSRGGRAWSVAFDAVVHVVEEAGDGAWPDGPAGAVRLVSVGRDGPGGLEVRTELQVLASGLVRVRAGVRNLAEDVYEVAHLEPALPVPAQANELLDMAGRHTHERTPQRRPFGQGSWVREAWGGRPGHDSATVMVAGRAGFGGGGGRGGGGGGAPGLVG